MVASFPGPTSKDQSEWRIIITQYTGVYGSLVPRPNKQGPIRVENITDDHSRQEFMDINNLSWPSAYLLLVYLLSMIKSA